MRTLILAAFLVFFGAVLAHAKSMQVTFRDLQSVIPTEDAALCDARYGDGYTTSPHSNGAAHHKESDAGHVIHIEKSHVSLHHGVYVMQNEYTVSFKGADVDQTEAYVYATAVSRGSGFSGVFTDGRCKGQVMIAPK